MSAQRLLKKNGVLISANTGRYRPTRTPRLMAAMEEMPAVYRLPHDPRIPVS
jgi:hypothetical protein